ncbi:hypothetical protein COLO4_36057 [Corchorus olitorius]|uniref:Uncharacterized protein n=1 Tax=Corchorus olitorius TaxID=93759 RepID=A0A1R3GBC5_9ROSI|nr:hypothetical protein COLO4_36057 [Corchorus olitorius]
MKQANANGTENQWVDEDFDETYPRQLIRDRSATGESDSEARNCNGAEESQQREDSGTESGA